ncbi:Uncharacterised protein [Sphingobacterium spiritivorum]|uniref:Uncharacterized protein n=1 Tax=Sphingobacterium spiritivorum TaxID=258 RepID=A0A380CGI6_SPHSI|nr:hypothetical protein [Sphingobacterium spiritivorum]SUJ18973.1 Uncharacterised protein [Sphingobacterium spiritivorum]
MSTTTEKITISDRFDFRYEVTIEHKPHFGFSTALYDDEIIGQVELGRINEPMGDDDREWEQYQERFSEWTDEIKTNMIPICKSHFNKS